MQHEKHDITRMSAFTPHLLPLTSHCSHPILCVNTIEWQLESSVPGIIIHSNPGGTLFTIQQAKQQQRQGKLFYRLFGVCDRNSVYVTGFLLFSVLWCVKCGSSVTLYVIICFGQQISLNRHDFENFEYRFLILKFRLRLLFG